MNAFTPENRERILGFLTDGATIADACHLVGIHPDTFFRWQARVREDPEVGPELRDFFEGKVPRARAARLAVAQAVITDSLKEGVPEDVRRAAAFRVVNLAMKAEALDLKRRELDDGRKVIHSGAIGITDERRAELNIMRRDPAIVEASHKLMAAIQAKRLASMQIQNP